MLEMMSSHGLAVLAVVALVVAVWLFMLGGTRLVRAVPPVGRSAHQDLPPRYWQLLGWLGHAATHWVGPWISPTARRRLQEQLRRGGLEFSLSVEQFVAGQVLGSLLAALVLLLAWSPNGLPASWMVLMAMAAGFILPASWLRDLCERRSRQITKTLPFYLDVITLAIEAGSNMTGAFQHAADKGPAGPMAEELRRVLRDIRAGRTRADALRSMAERLRIPAVSNWIAAILSAEKQGSSLGPILRAQADQRRNERFMQAEAMALKAPVKMLFPLMTCIFPCTFIIVFFPIGVRILSEGLL
ncbi:MAG: type II secretion system F family protein [Lautropia sp.]|nr:type II secretion system F family protein [Lautropia sp.]